MHSIKEIQAWFDSPRRGKTERANMGQMRSVTATSRLGEPLAAESGIQAGFCRAAEFSPYVQELVTEPFTCQLNHRGEQCRYTPDALAKTPSGFCVVECKPYWKRIDRDLRDFFASARAYFAVYGLRFVVIDELDVGSMLLTDNIAWLWPLRSAAEFDAKAEHLTETLSSIGDIPWVQALALGFGPFDIGRALARRLIFTDLHEPLRHSSMLRISPIGDHRDLLSKLGNYRARDLRHVLSLEEAYA